jgi:hypothetical protein
MESKAPGVGEDPTVVGAVQAYLRNLLTAACLEDYQRKHGRFTRQERRAAAEIWIDAERGQSQ